MKRLWIILWLALLPFYAGAIDRSEILLARSAARQHGGDVEWYLLVTQTLQEAGLKDVELFYRLFNRWSYVVEQTGLARHWIAEAKGKEDLSGDHEEFINNNIKLLSFLLVLFQIDSLSHSQKYDIFGVELLSSLRRLEPHLLRFTANLIDEDWQEEVRNKIIKATGNDPLSVFTP